VSITFKHGILSALIVFILLSLSAAMAIPVFAALPLVYADIHVSALSQIPVVTPETLKAAQEAATRAAEAQAAEARRAELQKAEPLLGATILVDPGHGGADPGAISGGVEEKNVVLGVSLRLRTRLLALGANVDMTRDYDKTLTLQERSDASNRLCPDLFLAVHGNSVAKRTISGIETYYFNSRGQKLATVLLNTLARELHEEAKWSHARNLFVLDHNDVPASLVEIGYLTNARTRALLKTPAYQDKVASALADSVVTYLADHNAERGCLT